MASQNKYGGHCQDRVPSPGRPPLDNTFCYAMLYRLMLFLNDKCYRHINYQNERKESNSPLFFISSPFVFSRSVTVLEVLFLSLPDSISNKYLKVSFFPRLCSQSAVRAAARGTGNSKSVLETRSVRVLCRHQLILSCLTVPAIVQVTQTASTSASLDTHGRVQLLFIHRSYVI